MTTTLFTQLPTACVTGDTICSIMYDTFHREKDQVRTKGDAVSKFDGFSF